MQRVMITGGPGSGKSTLARKLGEVTGLPVFHMDHIHHLPCWEPRPLMQKIAMANAIEAQAAWIFEGGLSATYTNRAARADTMIWLDLPVGLRLWRVVKRTIRDYGKTRPDVAEGCTETFDAETVAFWKWIWQTRHSQRARLARLATANPHLTLYHLQSRAEVDDFLRGLRQTSRMKVSAEKAS